jgi:hypothetical protein
MPINGFGYTAGSFHARFGKRTPTAHQFNESWKQLRARNSQQFTAENAALSSSLGAAAASYIDGMALITGKVAMARIQAAAKAKLAEVNKLA